ncbi:MAG TPA: hypothetical protein VK689_04515, partial [Armatimonadota bacterium]|nr:hypothetical protein [Armatimonadota bacterium]
MSIAAVSIPLQASPSVPVLRVVSDEREWDALEGEWNELFDASPTASPPLRFEWLREWWRLFGPVYGDRGSGLRVYTVRRESQLIGALPLYVGASSRLPMAPRRLGFLSTGEAEAEETCATYLDLLHLPGAAAECLE